MWYTGHITKTSFLIVKEASSMPSNEKEYNGNLFDQLSIIERIERQLENGGVEAAKAEIEILKKEVNRKLYQQPPIKSE